MYFCFVVYRRGRRPGGGESVTTGCIWSRWRRPWTQTYRKVSTKQTNHYETWSELFPPLPHPLPTKFWGGVQRITLSVCLSIHISCKCNYSSTNKLMLIKHLHSSSLWPKNLHDGRQLWFEKYQGEIIICVRWGIWLMIWLTVLVSTYFTAITFISRHYKYMNLL